MMVPIIQSFSQLTKNYGKEGTEIIKDNCQDTIFGGFAPQSETAESLSKSLGNQTVLSGSVSRGARDPSRSLQMMSRPLMTADELKSIPKGNFIVMKTGTPPMKSRLPLFLNWGITLDKAYSVPKKSARGVLCNGGGTRAGHCKPSPTILTGKPCYGGNIWYLSRIIYILKNPFYCGDSLWQKKYVTDVLPTKLVKNNGEKEQYLVRGHHTAIIDRESFEKVQMIIASRETKNSSHPHLLSRKLFCPYCNRPLKQRIIPMTAENGYVELDLKMQKAAGSPYYQNNIS